MASKEQQEIAAMEMYGVTSREELYDFIGQQSSMEQTEPQTPPSDEVVDLMGQAGLSGCAPMYDKTTGLGDPYNL